MGGTRGGGPCPLSPRKGLLKEGTAHWVARRVPVTLTTQARLQLAAYNPLPPCCVPPSPRPFPGLTPHPGLTPRPHLSLRPTAGLVGGRGPGAHLRVNDLTWDVGQRACVPRVAPKGHVAVCSSGGGRDKAAIFPVGTEPEGAEGQPQSRPGRCLRLPSARSREHGGRGQLHNQPRAAAGPGSRCRCRRWDRPGAPPPPHEPALPLVPKTPPPRRRLRGSQTISLPHVGACHATT